MIRLISGLALAGVALAAILLLPPNLLRFAALGVALLAAREYLAMARRLDLAPSPLLTYAFVAVSCWTVSLPVAREDLLLLAGLALLLIDVLRRARALPSAAASLTAGLYVGVPLGLLVVVHELAGREAVLLLIATVVVSDSAQYYTGRMLGRHPLAPAISPKKTLEGAVGGLVFGTALMVVAGKIVLPFANRTQLALTGVAVVVLGICGDLFESRLKRAADMKDSSALIPGHGGVLDRIDALLFATPGFYFCLQALM